MSPTTMTEPVADAREAVYDVERLREDFPVLRQTVHGRPLVYLDNAATTQKPEAVLEAMQHYYEEDNANIHRAVHQLSERATRDYEEAREKVRAFLGAAEAREVIFVRGATEGINLVAASWGGANLKPGDEIVLTTMEHHSNIVPWQLVAERTGAKIRVVPINDDGAFTPAMFDAVLSDRTKIVSVVHLSNSLGTLNPVEHVIRAAHARGAKVLIDASQSASHLALDVQALGCDFLVFSGHKLYAPTGVGVLWGRAELLQAMPPWQGGGDMIRSVTFAKTTYADIPNRFEAGTPNIAGVIGLGAAVDYLNAVGLDSIAAHEEALLDLATERLRAIPGVRIVGTARHKAAVISFVVEDPPLSALDVGTRLDLAGVAVRTGHHCCQPVMERFGVAATARASFALYNTVEEVEVFAKALRDIVEDARRRAKARSLQVMEPQHCPAEQDLCHGVADTCPPKSDVSYAPPMGTTPGTVADEIAEVFDLLGDWNERYQYLIELGEKLPLMPDEFKTECTKVNGCQSVVYLTARTKPGEPDVVEFLADSDADLVRGLIAVLEHLFSGQKAEDILAFDVEGFFKRLGLDQHLSMNRRNGLAAMVQRVRKHAEGARG